MPAGRPARSACSVPSSTELQRRTTLERGGLRARQLLQRDIERINVHPVLDAAKPFARDEVISAGKGLLDRVAIVVAGAGFEPTTCEPVTTRPGEAAAVPIAPEPHGD